MLGRWTDQRRCTVPRSISLPKKTHTLGLWNVWTPPENRLPRARETHNKRRRDCPHPMARHKHGASQVGRRRMGVAGETWILGGPGGEALNVGILAMMPITNVGLFSIFEPTAWDTGSEAKLVYDTGGRGKGVAFHLQKKSIHCWEGVRSLFFSPRLRQNDLKWMDLDQIFKKSIKPASGVKW